MAGIPLVAAVAWETQENDPPLTATWRLQHAGEKAKRGGGALLKVLTRIHMGPGLTSGSSGMLTARRNTGAATSRGKSSPLGVVIGEPLSMIDYVYHCAPPPIEECGTYFEGRP